MRVMVKFTFPTQEKVKGRKRHPPVDTEGFVVLPKGGGWWSARSPGSSSEGG
jgi:hypothetical protein